jgi:glutamate-5-semialdehyde dehydrogenase
MTRLADAENLAKRAKLASSALANAPTRKKNAVLARAADALLSPSSILAENARDLDAARAAGLAPAMIERLTLDQSRLSSLAKALVEIAQLPDPVGEIDGLTTRPSGIQVGRMRVPLGVVLIVYESRPNVTVDAAALCIKAGDAVILRGGKEALHSNRALATILHDALTAEGLPADGALFVDDTDRNLLYALLQQTKYVDLAVPRGGAALIDAVSEHARVPVLHHAQGICHVYVHNEADLDVAERIIVNAKAQRPGVCNAAECLMVDASIASQFLPRAAAALTKHGVELRGDERAKAVVTSMKAATPQDFDTEFLALILAVKVVDGLDDAFAFIREHGTHHTASIVTKNHDVAMRFMREVDASCVLVNASTRFNDGGELGLGAELGISTTKLHAYGPMGLNELCARKFVVLGHGETRGSPP